MTTLAEDRAIREGLPVVRLLTAEAIAVATGSALIVQMSDGGEALVRLSTADEAIDAQRKAKAHLEELGLPTPPLMSHERAEELTRPLAVNR